MNESLLQPPGVLKLVGHEVRWTLLCKLARSDLRVQELGDLLALPQNLISYEQTSLQLTTRIRLLGTLLEREKGSLS